MNRSTSHNRYLLAVAPGSAVASITMLSIASLVGFLANAHVCYLIFTAIKALYPISSPLLSYF